LLLLPITTAAVAAEIIRLDIVFFHAGGTNALPKRDFCIAKGTCSRYFIAIVLNCYIQQQKREKKELLSLLA
jgi:hypothetical protein